jgi:hypothetical protein
MSILQEELNKRNLPDLFLGKEENLQNWESAKAFWKETLLKEEYGRELPKLTPSISVLNTAVDFAGKLSWEEVIFSFTYEEKTKEVYTQLIYPVGAETIPFFIHLNFGRSLPHKYLPIEEIIDNGFGVFVVDYNDITKDNADFTDGLCALFQKGERRGDDTGKLMYWAYMASQMLDYLSTRKEADKDKIGVVGHSRLGKTALLAGALDDRFAFVCSNNSGCSGAALSRNHCNGAERIGNIIERFSHWFAPNYAKYVGSDDNLPFDQHCLLSLIAPRPVFIGSAAEDIWADTDNQFLNCVAVSKIWQLYGKTGLITPDRLPKIADIFTDGEVGFHLRAGRHFLSRTDWLVYMDAVKKIK